MLPWWPCVNLAPLGRCGASKIMRSRVWPFGVTWRHRSRDHSIPGCRFSMGGPWWPYVYLVAPLWRYGVSNVGRSDVGTERKKEERKEKSGRERQGKGKSGSWKRFTCPAGMEGWVDLVNYHKWLCCSADRVAVVGSRSSSLPSNHDDNRHTTTGRNYEVFTKVRIWFNWLLFKPLSPIYEQCRLLQSPCAFCTGTFSGISTLITKYKT